jgi:hypothetical protein
LKFSKVQIRIIISQALIAKLRITTSRLAFKTSN